MKAIETLKSVWSNRWVKFGVVATLYVLWFVVWNRNLWWLLGVPVIYDIYISKNMNRWFLDRYRLYKKEHHTFRKAMEWVEALLFAMVLVIPLKTFGFGMYVIPSSSMERTLLVGDYIFVSKVAYGPKMPNTPLSFPFVQNTLPLTKSTPSYLRWIERPYKRLAGFGSVERDDVVIFNFPEGDTVAVGTIRRTSSFGQSMEMDVSTANYYDLLRSIGRKEVYEQTKVMYRPVDKRENYIKRCVAIAGDTIRVIDGDVYVNGVRQKEIPGVEYDYLLTTTEPISHKAFERLGINADDIRYEPESGRYSVPLTAEGVKLMRSLPQVTGLERFVNRMPGELIFPHTPQLYPWTEDNFGPLWIPKAGITVPLTMENLPVYERIIKNYERNQLETRGDQIYINGSPATEYTFQMDYYFMMGDNRHNSADSRYWGFVPIDHIEGRASFTWLSIEPGKNLLNGIRWKRLFKGIH